MGVGVGPVWAEEAPDQAVPDQVVPVADEPWFSEKLSVEGHEALPDEVTQGETPGVAARMGDLVSGGELP
ncbi:hypothetical protein G7066_07955 [Leucobacter coleopterorum]|uniref:Uncharacterized protein n=1 Tax=Leucobacter coleopterorum TaxID=2714933 RepID=A0ABX6K0F6_9MICO|nr:hypothetical protein [Leucobacter coleopterorum]QIM18569.1 hypothetical protein G7066_07955 [Leucobacter coleopterorum]